VGDGKRTVEDAARLRRDGQPAVSADHLAVRNAVVAVAELTTGTTELRRGQGHTLRAPTGVLVTRVGALAAAVGALEGGKLHCGREGHSDPRFGTTTKVVPSIRAARVAPPNAAGNPSTEGDRESHAGSPGWSARGQPWL